MFDLGQDRQSSRKVLRPHQVRALDMLRASLGRGNRRVVLQAPTGFGKTVIAAKIIEGAQAKGNRVIFTAPAVSLIGQTVDAFEAEGITGIGVMQANHPRTDPSAPVQVASVQTLARRKIPQAAVVVVDECHIRSEAVEKLMDERKDVVFVGLSATPWAKGMGLRWQDLVMPATISELIEGGFLSRFRAYAPHVPDLSGVKVRAGEYVEDALAEVMGTAKIMGDVLQTWLDKGEDRPTLAFGVNRKHADEMRERFNAAGVATAYVDAFTDRVERTRINRQFRNGEIRVIWSVRTMTTGVDLPVSCIVDAAPTQSEMLHVQKIGRGLRVNPGTEDCTILDFAGNSLRLGLVTDICHERLDDTKPGEKQPAQSVERLPKPCPKCGVLHAVRICPACGHERRPPPSGVEAADGELAELTPAAVKAPTMADKQAFWSMALWLDRERGKGGKLAKGLYKGRFGVWPRMLRDVPAPPDPKFMNYEKSRRIAYAKKMAKQEGRA